jgi:hypothetical protein
MVIAPLVFVLLLTTTGRRDRARCRRCLSGMKLGNGGLGVKNSKEVNGLPFDQQTPEGISTTRRQHFIGLSTSSFFLIQYQYDVRLSPTISGLQFRSPTQHDETSLSL